MGNKICIVTDSGKVKHVSQKEYNKLCEKAARQQGYQPTYNTSTDPYGGASYTCTTVANQPAPNVNPTAITFGEPTFTIPDPSTTICGSDEMLSEEEKAEKGKYYKLGDEWVFQRNTDDKLTDSGKAYIRQGQCWYPLDEERTRKLEAFKKIEAAKRTEVAVAAQNKTPAKTSNFDWVDKLAVKNRDQTTPTAVEMPSLTIPNEDGATFKPIRLPNGEYAHRVLDKAESPIGFLTTNNKGEPSFLNTKTQQVYAKDASGNYQYTDVSPKKYEKNTYLPFSSPGGKTFYALANSPDSIFREFKTKGPEEQKESIMVTFDLKGNYGKISDTVSQDLQKALRGIKDKNKVSAFKDALEAYCKDPSQAKITDLNNATKALDSKSVTSLVAILTYGRGEASRVPAAVPAATVPAAAAAADPATTEENPSITAQETIDKSFDIAQYQNEPLKSILQDILLKVLQTRDQTKIQNTTGVIESLIKIGKEIKENPASDVETWDALNTKLTESLGKLYDLTKDSENYTKLDEKMTKLLGNKPAEVAAEEPVPVPVETRQFFAPPILPAPKQAQIPSTVAPEVAKAAEDDVSQKWVIGTLGPEEEEIFKQQASVWINLKPTAEEKPGIAQKPLQTSQQLEKSKSKLPQVALNLSSPAAKVKGEPINAKKMELEYKSAPIILPNGSPGAKSLTDQDTVGGYYIPNSDGLLDYTSDLGTKTQSKSFYHYLGRFNPSKNYNWGEPVQNKPEKKGLFLINPSSKDTIGAFYYNPEKPENIYCEHPGIQEPLAYDHLGKLTPESLQKLQALIQRELGSMTATEALITSLNTYSQFPNSENANKVKEALANLASSNTKVNFANLKNYLKALGFGREAELDFSATKATPPRK